MVDRDTIAVYERRAADWIERRRPAALDRARDFAAVAMPPAADLGCGPGWYTAALPGPVVALDAAQAMLDLTGTAAPAALRVQGDLNALPFRAGALGSAWANASYVHVPRSSTPLALADLHRALRLGARVELLLFEGDQDAGAVAGDDFPGRSFSLWEGRHLRDVIVGAGFRLRRLDRRAGDRRGQLVARMTRLRTLPDTVGPGMRLLVCGLNPSLYAADAGVGFARPGNRFWSAAIAAGVASRAHDRDPRRALLADGVGLTDLVKRATTGAAELRPAEYRAGLARLDRLAAWLRPGAVCFVGLGGWRAAVDRRAVPGPQPAGVGGAPAYLMPSTSGLNARSRVGDLVEHLRAAAALGDANTQKQPMRPEGRIGWPQAPANG